MPFFIVRDIAGKSLGIVLAKTEADAIDFTNAQREAPVAVSAVHDNPARIKLSELVEESGLSNREFARRVLGRDVRSLARYLGGDVMPPELADQVLRMRLQVDASTITIEVQR